MTIPTSAFHCSSLSERDAAGRCSGGRLKMPEPNGPADIRYAKRGKRLSKLA
jgi:hypothetical protein